MTYRIFIIAGEASGDRLGGNLMAGISRLAPGTEFQGIGGPLMQGQGLTSIFPMEELSLMGLAEVLPKLRHLFALRDQAVAEIFRSQPDVLITIDSPDFCRRVAQKAKLQAPDLKVVHYVAPSVWAWRPNRAAKMAQSVDHVLALLPFEPPYMQRAGMSCDFVGHPIATETPVTNKQCKGFRSRHGIDVNAPLVSILPGSRKGEVQRLLPVFAAVADQILNRLPDVRFVIPTPQHLRAEVVTQTADWRSPPVIITPDTDDDEKRISFAASEVALAASGTVSLELAAADTPMVIAYDMNFLSRLLISRLLKVDTVTLVNLVSETRAVPEFLGADCKASQITPSLLELLQSADQQASQRRAFADTLQKLGRGNPELPDLPAQSVLKFIR